jgi:hypothetical protein
MINKGLDTTFIHFGIRKEDMEIIKNLTEEQGLNFEWLQENILKEFHNLKINNEDIDSKKIEKIIEKALNKGSMAQTL